ncbi:hypothetical protein FRC03_008558 [Tulasnella sp. 419]|nr:hypothetical protein FRC03_008558 [Tulasnella sp. 419]
MAAITPQSIASNFFRVAAWLYLRVIAKPYAPFGILGLYLLHLVSWSAERLPEEGPVAVKVVEMNGDVDKTPNGHQNGHATTESMTIIRTARNPYRLPLQLLFSLPSRSKYVRLSNLLINTLFLCMTLDFTFRPHLLDNTYDVTFARIGAVNPDSVKIHIRYPNLKDEDIPNTGVGALKVLWREAPDSAEGLWKDGPVVQLREDQDWVGVAKVDKLVPNTQYQVRLAFPNSTFLPCPVEPLTFTTFPDTRLFTGGRYKFILGSQVATNFPYNPIASNNYIRGFELLVNQLYPAPAPLIPTTPVTAADPSAEAEPEAKHLRHEAHLVVQPPPGELPDPAPAAQEYTIQTVKIPKETQTPSPNLPKLRFDKDTVHPVPPSFMILLGDLIETKIPRPFKQTQVNYEKAFRRLFASESFRKLYERIRAQQLTDLVRWAAKTNHTSIFKFIVSPVPLSALWGPEDSWAAYPSERTKVIDTFKYVPNVFVLSGSRHEFAAIEYLEGKIHEFNVGPLSDFAIPHALFTRLDEKNSKIVEVKSNVTVPFVVDEDGKPVSVDLIHRYSEEKLLKTVHRGNHKWVTVEIDTTNQRQPTATFELSVDGEVIWSHLIKGQAVSLSDSSAVGSVLKNNILGVLGRINLNPVSWLTGK